MNTPGGHDYGVPNRRLSDCVSALLRLFDLRSDMTRECESRVTIPCHTAHTLFLRRTPSQCSVLDTAYMHQSIPVARD